MTIKATITRCLTLTKLQDPFAECRERELRAELRRRVADVERRIDFNEIEGDERVRVGDELHDHVGLSIIEASLDRRAAARREPRVTDVEIERDVDAAGACGRKRDGTLGDDRDPLAV